MCVNDQPVYGFEDKLLYGTEFVSSRVHLHTNDLLLFARLLL